MRTRQVIAILLIVLGLVSLLWGGISWTREETVLDLGPIEATTAPRIPARSSSAMPRSSVRVDRCPAPRSLSSTVTRSLLHRLSRSR